MPELAVVVIVMAVGAGLLVVAPLRARSAQGEAMPAVPTERASAEVRHRVALEALRDVEADHRAGALDTETYRAELARAEAHAVETRAALDAEPSRGPATIVDPRARRAAVGVALAVGALIAIGALAPPPIGFAAKPIVNETLAAAQAAESARQDRIAELREALLEDPRDVEALSDLADAYLAGNTTADLREVVTILGFVIGFEPENESAYRRIITAYLRAGDYQNARAALDAFVELDPDPADVAFFSGLIALRGDGDAAVAVAAFDRFLELAPHDDRAPMVRALRAEAEGADANDVEAGE
jgi:cytochrome c-type biogenesis protein CcmH/NrfG